MKRLINCSMQEDKLSYGEKDALADEIFAIVKKYFDDWGTGRPQGAISYSQYDILEYTFHISNNYANSRTRFVAGTDTYDAPDLNAFRKEIKQVLKQYGFNHCKFDLRTFKVNEGNNTGYYTPYDRIYKYKELVAIYFGQ